LKIERTSLIELAESFSLDTLYIFKNASTLRKWWEKGFEKRWAGN
jgi:hypothetical protein